MDEFFVILIALVSVSNVLPILPVIQDYATELPKKERRNYRLRALIGAHTVAAGFMVGAPLLFDALSVNVGDLRLAGGVILITYATHDILFSRAGRNRRSLPGEEEELNPAIAPLGIPIMVGPATLSILVVLANSHGVLLVASAMVVNVAINAVIVVMGSKIVDTAGEGISRAAGKVMSLVLATLGASMLRTGIIESFG